MTQRQTAQRFRQRKLSTKQNLPVVREHEIEKTTAEEDAQRHIPRVETGVEKGEEIEHHLQAVISASAAAAVGGKVAQIYIPTPEAKASSVKYSDLYPRQFQQPATYIRFSSTVEDCTGTPYCMTSEDEAWLKVLNAKRERGRNSIGPCSEDAFEEVISFFEATAQTKQPFAAVDNPPVIPYDEMEEAFDDTIDTSARVFARDIYSHWKAQRLKRGNRPLMSNLKFETGQETDDADPYVTEKLKKLRKELEDARYLVHMVKQRELLRKEQLAIDRKIFEQRGEVKKVKRDLGVKGDDEDLINQKPVPKPSKLKTDAAIAQRAPGTVLRPPMRPDGRPPDTEIVSLDDQKAEKQRMIDRSVEERITQHQNWNVGFHDLTWRPLTPPLEPSNNGFQTVIVTDHALPSPPPSTEEDMDIDGAGAPSKPTEPDEPIEPPDSTPTTTFGPQAFRSSTPLSNLASTTPAASPQPLYPDAPVLSFRTRTGRNNRTWLDRRITPSTPPTPSTLLHPFSSLFNATKAWHANHQIHHHHAPDSDLDFVVADRMKYESDNDEDDGEGGFVHDLLYPVDHYSDESMRLRSAFAVGGRRDSVGQGAALGQQQGGGQGPGQAQGGGQTQEGLLAGPRMPQVVKASAS
ncbi:MAG: hypothetical protein Q9165_005444 [Trypethelium subeluteriae]